MLLFYSFLKQQTVDMTSLPHLETKAKTDCGEIKEVSEAQIHMGVETKLLVMRDLGGWAVHSTRSKCSRSEAQTRAQNCCP